jgi:hypothetical protein
MTALVLAIAELQPVAITTLAAMWWVALCRMGES